MVNVFQRIINFIFQIDLALASASADVDIGLERAIRKHSDPAPIPQSTDLFDAGIEVHRRRYFDADTTIPPTPATEGLPTFMIDNPLAISGNLEDILNAVTNLLLTVSIPLAALMYLWAGFQFLTSGGEEKGIKSAKQTLIWTTIGVVVLLTARGMVVVVRGLLTP